MAATDQPYRHQKTLDIVFAVSCVLMLVSIVGMFAQDFLRPFKVEQRRFRDVETALAERTALNLLPNPEQIKAAEDAVATARERLDQPELKAELKSLTNEIDDLLPVKVRNEARYQAIKADYDSYVSLYNIEVDHHGLESSKARQLKAEVTQLGEKLEQQLRAFEDSKDKLDAAQRRKDQIEKPLTDGLAQLKKLNTDFDRFAKMAAQKRWKMGDLFRMLPVIDAFASPTRIEQFTLEELPIEYGSFKRVTRFDRCHTCHLGIDRPAYDKPALQALRDAPEELRNKLDQAQAMIRQRKDLLKGTKEKLDYDASDLRLKPVELEEARVNEFCAHPRLDLFVDGNSPHPSEKFGCTSCHAGQGSATSFGLAAHTPNDTPGKERWKEEHGWAAPHYWDFPMLPQRFIESSCLKCHYQVTDLIRQGNKNEAPKLLKGYNLVRENGCFGCHEIAGIKSGRWVGPDLRLEPSPALEELSPGERARAQSDPLNPPGTLRKVGPSLRRLSEKTHEDWVRKWIRAPRDFRPDTKMPHFYGLANNTPEALAGTDQVKFPDAEIHAVTHYLLVRSREYLAGVESVRKESEDKIQADRTKLETLRNQPTVSDAEKKELDELARRLRMRETPGAIAEVQLPADYKEDKARGRQLFTERGCLACHMHAGTTTASQGFPAVTNDVHFGPNLSRMAAKLGTKPGDRASAQRWLIHWIKNPTVHHPRTFMPITHLEDTQAADIAAWLLDQPAEWNGPEVPEPELDTLKNLAKVYLEKVGTRREVESLLHPKEANDRETAQVWLQSRSDNDEAVLKGELDANKLKLYVGKKAIGQLGCYACHDIPGFEAAKPIGTPLNDWGKKDAERLAFEDIHAYIQTHYHPVPRLVDENGRPAAFDNGKPPYEQYFLDLLEHHQREGFLYQKLREPRSYDYERMRKWDERLRMPQFQFSRTIRKTDEDEESFKARKEKEEAEGREAVMTFILGLVAEPMPGKYVYSPTGDRLAEVKGRQVLDKFNCAGCHQVRSGVYEFKKTDVVLADLEQASSNAQSSSDHPFPSHSAWAGPRTQTERFTAYGVPGPAVGEEEKKLVVRLTEALRFTNGQKEIRDIPAGAYVGISTEALLAPPSEPYGGTFVELLVSYLKQRDRQLYNEDKTARAALPPPLLREGEKTQPGWLFQFLRNPQIIRPLTVLRMPRFNMSDDEAMALVNYFEAADRMNNPGETLNYPYLAIPQRDDAYWQARSTEYVARLKAKGLYDQRVEELRPIWEQQLKDRVTELERKVADAAAMVKATKEADARKSAEKTLAHLQTELKQVKDEAQKNDKKSPFFRRQLSQWEAKDAYLTDAYRLLASYNTPCLNCHRVGQLPAKQDQAPPLELTAERLRPEWTLRWLANPDRLISYPTPMPQNFPADKVDAKTRLSTLYPEFAGTTLEQVIALRDLLMILPKAAEMPENRNYRPTQPAGEGAQ